MSKIEDLFRACALSSPVTFLTGRSRTQIGFNLISPSASSTRDLGTRLASTLTSMKLGTNPSDSQSSYASAIHLNSLALISFLDWLCSVAFYCAISWANVGKFRYRIYRQEKSGVKEIQICENMELVGIFRKKRMKKSALAKLNWLLQICGEI